MKGYLVMEEDKKQSRPNGQQDESAQGKKEMRKELIEIIKALDGLKNKTKKLLDKL